MGNQQNKDIVVEQNVTKIDKKMFEYEIVFIVACVLLSLIIFYILRRQCMKKVRTWLRREVNVVTATPIVKVETLQPKPTAQHARVVVS